MKRSKSNYICIVLLVTGFAASSFSCSKGDNADNYTNANEILSRKMKIQVNSKVFTATLADNATARAFAKLLPLTINMKELNGNEKYFDLPYSLPAQPTNPRDIKNGDIMLYGTKTLVLFYQLFSTSYSYTKIGTLDNIEGYMNALGTGPILVRLSLE